MASVTKSLFVAALAAALMASCIGIEDLELKQYEFGAEKLDTFFIYRDRLPADMYAFNTPQELYLSLQEPYTGFFSRDSARAYMALLTTSYGGVGFTSDSVYNGQAVIQVFPESPGEKAGLLPNDTITAIGIYSIAGMDMNTLQELIPTEIGVKVVLKVKRGEQLLNISVTIGEFLAPSVYTDSVDESTAYIMLTGFYQETVVQGGSAQEFGEAMAATQWAENTIVDIRSNGGGYVDQCFTILNDLVAPNSPMIVIRSQGINPENGLITLFTDTVLADGDGGTFVNRKLYILVDNWTASASEMMVSCLRQRSNVVVIGQTTYGKGCGQALFTDGPGGVMAKVTCMTVHPADAGEPLEYNKIGIPPDISVDYSEDAYDVALSTIHGESAAARRKGSFSKRPGRPDVPVGIKQPTAIFDGERRWR